MKNYAFIENANAMLKTVAADLRDGNKEYSSISRVLKDMQSKECLKAGYAKVFEALGLEGGKVTPPVFLAAVCDELKGEDKKGNEFVGLWGWKIDERDEEGKVIKKSPVLRKVTAWSPNKVFKVIAQSIKLQSEEHTKVENAEEKTEGKAA